MESDSLGTYLKREREFRQITLEEVSMGTRIGRTALEALEADHYDTLPGPTFVKGYLKAYAQHIGLDAADVVLRYEHWLKHEMPSELSTRGEGALNERRRPLLKYIGIAVVIAAILALAAFLSTR